MVLSVEHAMQDWSSDLEKHQPCLDCGVSVISMLSDVWLLFFYTFLLGFGSQTI